VLSKKIKNRHFLLGTKNMFTSLRTRLFMAFVLVVTLAVIMVAWVANWRTTAEFNQFIAQDIAAEEAALAQMVSVEMPPAGK
jgi:hypothetical protein